MEEIVFPDNLKAAYQTALQRARDELRRLSPVKVAECSGAQLTDISGRTLRIALLDRVFEIDIDSGSVLDTSSLEPASIYESLVLIHYLIHADGSKLTHEWVPYRDLPDGQVYYRNFLKRVNRPLKRVMDGAAAPFFSWLSILPGEPADYGDFSYVLNVLPGVPMLFIYWQGDEEVDSENSVLFDSSAPNSLPMEDLVVLAEIICYHLLGSFRKQAVLKAPPSTQT